MPEGKTKILLIDDDRFIREVVRDILEREGYQIVSAITGEEGLELIRKEKPDLVLLDVMLPGKDGFFICKQIRQEKLTKHLPVIFLTMLNEPRSRIQSFQCGGNDFVNKPFDSVELLTRITTQLRLFNQRQELEMAYQQLRDSQERLLESVHLSVGTYLTRWLVQELSNPLSVILGFSQGILRQLSGNQNFSEPLNNIERETLRCKEVLQNILSLFEEQPTEEILDLNQIIEETLKLIEHQFLFKTIDIRKKLDQSLPTIRANRGKMLELFVNLVMDAVKSIGKTGEIELTTSYQVKGEETFVEARVRDSGDVLPAEEKDKSSQPFFSLRYKDGLRVSLSHQIVQSQGGSLAFESTPGLGSVVTVILPVKDRADTGKDEKDSDN